MTLPGVCRTTVADCLARATSRVMRQEDRSTTGTDEYIEERIDCLPACTI